MKNRNETEEKRECLLLMGPFDGTTRPVTRIWRGNGLIVDIDEMSEDGSERIRYAPRLVDCECGAETVVFVFKGKCPSAASRRKRRRDAT